MYFKREPYRNKKILQHAKGQQCTVNSPVCNYNPETVVAAHSNWAEDGKGMSQKADDCFVCFACSDCHQFLDEGDYPDEVKRDYFHRALKKTLRILLDDKILK